MNWNVLLNLILAGIAGVADSIWTGTIFVAFLSDITNQSNTKIGFVTALQGTAGLLSAFPAGYLADKYPRSRIIIAGGVILIGSAICAIYATSQADEKGNEYVFILFCISLAAFGIADGVRNGPTQALLADSLPTGSREGYYNGLFVIYLLAGAIGPILAIVYFSISQGYFVGSNLDDDTAEEDAWPIDDLKYILIIGLALEVPCGILMFFFRDDKSLNRESESFTVVADSRDTILDDDDKTKVDTNHVASSFLEPLLLSAPATASETCEEEAQRREQQQQQQQGDGGDADPQHRTLDDGSPSINGSSSGSSSSTVLLSSTNGASDLEARLCEKETSCLSTEDDKAEKEWRLEVASMSGFGGLITVKSVPYIVFGADLLIALASGMTIRFFPLFFKDDCSLSPAQVQTIYAVTPIVMAAVSTLGTHVSERIGRVQAVGLLRISGLTCFASMVVLYHSGAPSWAIVVLYVARTALMNSTYPIEESILMDYVEKSERARWKSLESVSSFGWCGSALLGGYLSDANGYTFTFIVTILMQSTATLGYLSLATVVSAKRRPKDVQK